MESLCKHLWYICSDSLSLQDKNWIDKGVQVVEKVYRVIKSSWYTEKPTDFSKFNKTSGSQASKVRPDTIK